MLVGTEENQSVPFWAEILEEKAWLRFGMAGSIQTPVTRKDLFQLQSPG